MTEIDWDRPCRCRHCGQPSRVRAVLALSGRCGGTGRRRTGSDWLQRRERLVRGDPLCRVRAGFGAPCEWWRAAGRFRLRRRSGIRPDAVRPLPSAALGAWRVRMPDTPAGILPMSAVLPQAFGRDELARGRHEP